MYIVAGVYGHARRDTMQKRAQFFSDFLASLDPRGVYDDVALKRFFDFLFLRLLAETNGDGSIFPDMMI